MFTKRTQTRDGFQTKRPRGRPSYKLSNPRVKEMIDYYADGMPKYILAEEFGISEPTIRRLIREYESINGKKSLRINRVIRYGGYKCQKRRKDAL